MAYGPGEPRDRVKEMAVDFRGLQASIEKILDG
jgi:hypothetical protein